MFQEQLFLVLSLAWLSIIVQDLVKFEPNPLDILMFHLYQLKTCHLCVATRPSTIFGTY